MPKFAKIIVNVHHQQVDKIYTYKLKEEDRERARVGMLTRVPFANNRFPVEGFIVDLSDEAEYPEEKLRYVTALSGEEPLLREQDLILSRWMQHTYMAPLSSCLSLMLPKIRFPKTPQKQKVRLLRSAEELSTIRLGKAQAAFLEALTIVTKTEETPELSGLRDTTPITKASLESLIQQEILEVFQEEASIPAAFHVDPAKKMILNPDQRVAYEAIRRATTEERYEAFLLHGITGSGKTEVYMQAIESVLERGKEAIVLVPEISLTPQLIAVFTNRFGAAIGVTHSRMTDKERSLMWYKARRGEFKVMIGPRSALFTPFQHLGLVIIDEEHEATYRSEKMAPHYHAREVAMEKCRLSACPLVLGSATPSVETYYRAETGEFRLLTMTRRAVKGAELPYSRIMDMRRELQNGNLSILCEDLTRAIRKRLENHEQTILFLNRKGYSTSVSCRKCGFVLKCPRCNLPYTYHREKDRLICHHCGKETRLPVTCPECGSKYLKQFGVGTERVEETVRSLFPQANIVRMDMGTMKSREDYERVYEDFSGGSGDILIGTQMVAKGFDFPRVTLVGILAADMTLYDSDYHGVERTFQLLTQVSGRAGRSGKQGEVMIQTYSPDHYAIQSAKRQDYLAFYRDEIKMRRAMECPPFTHIGQMAFQGPSEEEVLMAARHMAEEMRRLTANKPIEILGPSPARLVRVNNIFRYKILVKCREEARLRSFLTYCFDQIGKPLLDAHSRVLITVDMDPMSLL